jgi:hypothetical protein
MSQASVDQYPSNFTHIRSFAAGKLTQEWADFEL